MRKKLVLLLMAIAMAFAISTTVNAYDALQPEWPDTQFELAEIHHWVVRGDTLASISATYGVPVADIMARNFFYFRDLWLRNVTYGLAMELEPGVRLHIGYLLEVRHWVIRGDTFANIGNGDAWRVGGLPAEEIFPGLGPGDAAVLVFGIDADFTAADIVLQNAQWFLQLGDLNLTRAVSYALEESFHMLRVPNWTLQAVGSVPGAVTGVFTAVNTMEAFNPAKYGSPLILRSLVNPDPTEPIDAIDMPFSHLVWLHDGGPHPLFPVPPFLPGVIPAGSELDGANMNVGPLQQTSFNPWATNPLIFGVPLGWSRAPLGVVTPSFLFTIPGGGFLTAWR